MSIRIFKIPKVLAIVIGLLAFSHSPLAAQGPQPLKAEVKSGGIATLDLIRVDRPVKVPVMLELAWGELQAFESGPGTFWTLYPKSEKANEEDLTSFELSGGSVAVGIDPKTKKFGKFDVPKDKLAYVVACSSKKAAQFMLVKSQLNADKTKLEELGRMYITILGTKDDDGKVIPNPDDGKTIPNPPNPNKVDQVYVAVIYNTADITPALSKVVGDTQFWNDLTAGGSDWDGYPHNSAEAEKKGYIKALEKVQAGATSYVPGILVLNKENGKVLKAEKLPIGADAKDLIKKLVAEVRK